MHDFYDVSLSAPDKDEWGDECSVLAVSPIRAAEEHLKDEAKRDGRWLESEWDALVRKGEREWRVRLSRPRVVIVTTAEFYTPDMEGASNG